MMPQIVSLISFLILFNFCSNAQFAGPVGSSTTTAIHKDSSVIINWAISSTIERGFQNSSNQSAGFTTVGDSISAIGAAGTNGVVSLGDGGSAILQFNRPIINGVGPDFAVFENAFNATFLELAFVEVSSDGVNYVRFPAISNAPTDQQYGAFSNNSDATLTNNLAGKYVANYGTPFDLEELVGAPNIDLNSISHIKITDVVGSIDSNFATYDSQNNPINDPFPTEFASGGFDLDAVGVIHQLPLGLNSNTFNDSGFAFPNPFSTQLNIQIPSNLSAEIKLTNCMGNIVFQKFDCQEKTNVDVQFLPIGMYFLECICSDSSIMHSSLVKQ